MDAQSGPYKYELLQVLLVVVLGFAHVPLYLFAAYLFLVTGPLFSPLGIVFGALELAASVRVPPTLAVLKQWLLIVGVLTVVFSLAFLVYGIALVYMSNF